MNFDYSKLRGRIVEKFGSISKFADAYGISLNSMSRKLNGKIQISTADIEKMSSEEFLDIDSADYPVYFFAVKVQ